MPNSAVSAPSALPSTPRAASKLFHGPFDEAAVRAAVRATREELGAGYEPTFGILFATSDYIPHLPDFLETVRLHAHLPTLVGASGQGLVGFDEESENKSGFSLLLLHLPGTTVRAIPLKTEGVDEAESHGPATWHRLTGVSPQQTKGWFVVADPYSFPVERWITQWNRAYLGIDTFGGLASGLRGTDEACVFLNGDVIEGGIAVSFEGAIAIHTIVSQGCKPIGEPYTITGADQNILYTLGSQPAYKILDGAFQGLSDSEKERARGHLFAGLAMSEYVEEFKPGDFLVRSILGADPNTGAVAIAARPRVGQTLQYQLRDAEAASRDLHQRLIAKKTELDEVGTVPIAALLCTCNGRGEELFGKVSHDAAALAHYFPKAATSGFFANGEIGPVGHQAYIHGYTASIALFCAV